MIFRHLVQQVISYYFCLAGKWWIITGAENDRVATLGTVTNGSSSWSVEMANWKIHVEFRQIFFKRSVFICCFQDEFLNITTWYMIYQQCLIAVSFKKVQKWSIRACYVVIIYTFVQQSSWNNALQYNRIKWKLTHSTHTNIPNWLRHKHVKIYIFIFTSLTTYIHCRC